MRDKPIHIQLSEPPSSTVFVMGDPGRVRMLSSHMSNVRVINEKRGFLIVKGEYRGKQLTLASHGIGGPSILILLEELILSGARRIIRLGTAGSLDRALKPGSVVIASGATFIPGTCGLQFYHKQIIPPMIPSIELVRSAYSYLVASGLNPVLAPVFCSDSFYAESWEKLKEALEVGVKAVDMETASLYALSNIRGFEALSILVVSNTIYPGGEEVGESNMINDMITRVFLEVADKLSG
jgi:5'-methylthioadenosine phosphorylase